MSLAKHSILFTLGTLLSRLTGLLRESILGGVFGASVLLDAFLVAFRIPNLFREMLAEGALGSSFTKVYSQVRQRSAEEAAKLLFQGVYFFFLVSLVLCSLGILFSPELVKAMTLKADSVFSSQFIYNGIGLTRILFPFLGIAMLGSIFMGALHEKGSFFTSAVTPVLFNLGYIVGALILADLFESWNFNWVREYFGEPKIVGLAVGVLIGGLAQLLAQIYACRQQLSAFRLSFLRYFPMSDDLRAVIKLMIPAAIAAGAGPINVFINTNFATSLGEGAVSWLSYGFRLLQLPIGLFGVAIGVAVLPTLSRAVAKADGAVVQPVVKHLGEALALVGLLMMICFSYLVVNAEDIIQLLFRHGAFTQDDSLNTSQALFAYSFGILGYGLIKVLSSFYYAVDRTKFAMKVSILGIGFNLLGNYLLVDHYGHVGLAATSSVTLSFNAIFLMVGLWPYRHFIKYQIVCRYLLLLGLGTSLGIMAQLGVQQGIDTIAIGHAGKFQSLLKLFCTSGVLMLVVAVYLKTLLGVTWSELFTRCKALVKSR